MRTKIWDFNEWVVLRESTGIDQNYYNAATDGPLPRSLKKVDHSMISTEFGRPQIRYPYPGNKVIIDGEETVVAGGDFVTGWNTKGNVSRGGKSVIVLNGPTGRMEFPIAAWESLVKKGKITIQESGVFILST